LLLLLLLLLQKLLLGIHLLAVLCGLLLRDEPHRLANVALLILAAVVV
jgi:hypothetical protein